MGIDLLGFPFPKFLDSHIRIGKFFFRLLAACRLGGNGNGIRSRVSGDLDQFVDIRSIGGYPPVKIIDTPGYGDTRGIERDKEITAQIKQLFYNEISTLNAVCFVTKSSNNRLSHSQRYILSSILDLKNSRSSKSNIRC